MTTSELSTRPFSVHFPTFDIRILPSSLVCIDSRSKQMDYTTGPRRDAEGSPVIAVLERFQRATVSDGLLLNYYSRQSLLKFWLTVQKSAGGSSVRNPECDRSCACLRLHVGQCDMPSRTYLVSVCLSAGLTLLCALPFVLIALWRSRIRRWGLVLFVGSLVILENMVAELPRVNGFQHLHWSWQAALLTMILTLLVVSLTPEVSFASIGVTSTLKPGWLEPSIIALLIAAAVPAVVFSLGSRVRLTGGGGLTCW